MRVPFGVVARASGTVARVVPGARGASDRYEPSGRDGLKVCAFAQIRWQKAIDHVKSFCVRLGAVWVGVRPYVHARAGQVVHTRRARAENTKVLLLSGFLFACAARCTSMRCVRRVMPCRWRCLQRGWRRRRGDAPCEIFSPGLLTVKKTVIRFRHSRPCCEQSEQNRHPVAKHNLDIHLASEDGGDGVASPGELQGPFPFDTCPATCGGYPRIRHDALDATAVPAMSHCGFALPGRFHSIDH
jgi:hypothetical protein